MASLYATSSTRSELDSPLTANLDDILPALGVDRRVDDGPPPEFSSMYTFSSFSTGGGVVVDYRISVIWVKQRLESSKLNARKVGRYLCYVSVDGSVGNDETGRYSTRKCFKAFFDSEGIL